MTDDSAPQAAARPMRCTVAGGSLVGLSTAIALSRLGLEVTVAERSPARAVDGGGGLGVDVDLLREVTGMTRIRRCSTGSTGTAPRGTCCRAGSRSTPRACGRDRAPRTRT